MAWSSEYVSNLDIDSSQMWFNQHCNDQHDPDSGFAATFNPSNTPTPSLPSSVQISNGNIVLPEVVPNLDIVEMVSEATPASTPEGGTPSHATNSTETHHSTIFEGEHDVLTDYGHSHNATGVLSQQIYA